MWPARSRSKRMGCWMKVEFWFDPVCPFCWMTSRWINEVAKERDLEIDWRPISLLFKNDTQPDSPFFERVVSTRNLLRVCESVRAAGHADHIGALYTELGRRIHHQSKASFETDEVAAILTDLELDAGHAQALSDESFDTAIRSAMADGLSLVGDDVGTPIIAVEGGAGRVGFFGPVITKFPTQEQALRLWDGFLTMANVDGFFELKRTRQQAPDMSTVQF